MQKGSTPFGGNVFAEAFQQFDEEAFFQNLEDRVKPLPYFTKYKGFKTTLLWLSYLFNIFSVLTASYAVFWFTQWITGFASVGWVVACIFLFFLEKLKRKSSTEFWQVYFFDKKIAAGWLVLCLVCLSLSLVSSVFGTKQGTENLAPDAELIAADSTATGYRGKIQELEDENRNFEKQKDHTGTIYYRLQSVIRTNKAMIADYQKRVLELDKKLEGKNEKLTTAYQEKVELTAWTLVWVTVAMELLFEACLAYIWYYYFRSYVERKMLDTNQSPLSAQSGQPMQPPTLSDEILVELEAIKNEMAMLKKSSSINAPHQQGAANGNTGTSNGAVKSRARPIGFYTDSQLMAMGIAPGVGNNSESGTCTHVYTEIDKYTIPHNVTGRNGQKRTVRYTLSQIENRISDYEGRVEEAISKKMALSVLENRKEWLAYWQGRRLELLDKMRSPNSVAV